MSFRTVAGLLLLAACSTGTQTAANNGQVTGGATPQLAVEQFLRAVKATDLQAMSAVWGTKAGPARETMDRTQMEKRETILAGCFAHDNARILGERPGAQGRRELRVELKKGNLTRQTTFYTVQGPRDRWYVEDMDIAAVRDLCGNSGTGRSGH